MSPPRSDARLGPIKKVNNSVFAGVHGRPPPHGAFERDRLCAEVTMTTTTTTTSAPPSVQMFYIQRIIILL